MSKSQMKGTVQFEQRGTVLVATMASLPSRVESSEFLCAVGASESTEAQRAYVERLNDLSNLPITNRKSVQQVLAQGRFVQ